MYERSYLRAAVSALFRRTTISRGGRTEIVSHNSARAVAACAGQNSWGGGREKNKRVFSLFVYTRLCICTRRIVPPSFIDDFVTSRFDQPPGISGLFTRRRKEEEDKKKKN